jgi:glycerophosphoryl diester phosphodiesterase
VLLVAHRIPATRAACERLAAEGARVFEADVQIDDRNRPVVSHYLPLGTALQRDNWRVRARLRAAHDPLLRDVVERIPDPCLVLLDLKETDSTRRNRLTSALLEWLPDRGRFRACGGRGDDLDAMRAAGFRTWRTIGDAAQLRDVLALQQLPDEAVSIRQSLLSAGVVAALHERVPSVIAWTINTVLRARQVHTYGVDGLTTDRRTVLREMSRLN